MVNQRLALAAVLSQLILTIAIQAAPASKQWQTEPDVMSDSVSWSDRRQEGFDRWHERVPHFPVLKSPAAQAYVSTFAQEFIEITATTVTPAMLPKDRMKVYRRNLRFQVFFADTLNPSIWSQGGGHMIIHGGVLAQATGAPEFCFLLALEMAHEALGLPITDEKPLQIPFLGRAANAQVWSVDGFATLVLSDPILEDKIIYTLRQESEALALVAQVFIAFGWDYDATSKSFLSMLKKMIEVPAAGSLGLIHKNIGLALKLPVARSTKPSTPRPVPVALQPKVYAALKSELLRSTQQRFPWFLRLAPYLDLILNPSGSASKDLERLASLEKKTDSVYKDPHRARTMAWIESRVQLNHRQWPQARDAANAGLKIESDSEPLLFQRMQALLLGDQPEACVEAAQTSWIQFDYLRELLRIQCLIMDGRLSEALKLADAYVIANPEEVQGAFWQVFLKLRLRIPGTSVMLHALDQRWGDRPILRALHLLQAGYDRNKTEVQRLVKTTDLDIYSRQEQGMLDFARAWALFETRDSDADHYMKSAQESWPLTQRYGRLLPQPVQ